MLQLFESVGRTHIGFAVLCWLGCSWTSQEGDRCCDGKHAAGDAVQSHGLAIHFFVGSNAWLQCLLVQANEPSCVPKKTPLF